MEGTDVSKGGEDEELVNAATAARNIPTVATDELEAVDEEENEHFDEKENEMEHAPQQEADEKR